MSFSMDIMRSMQNINSSGFKNLPIFTHKYQILEVIEKNQVSIIQAETGSGKSTQIPQYLLESYPNAKIVITQPRRMAAIGVASRVASEQNTQLGERVGYQIKGENKLSLNTSIVFMTTGILIQIISHIPAHKPLP